MTKKRGNSVTAMKSERLASAVEGRRRELGLSPTMFATVTGVTAQGLMPLRQGLVKRYQERLTGPVCRVFGWSPDSIDRLLDDKDPIVIGGGYQPPEVDPVKALEQQLTKQLRDAQARIERLESELRDR